MSIHRPLSLCLSVAATIIAAAAQIASAEFPPVRQAGAIRVLEPRTQDIVPAPVEQIESAQPIGETGRRAAAPRGLRLPADLPGADAPPLQLPPHDPDRPDERLRAIDKLFPPLPPLPDELRSAAGPEGRPMQLAHFENIAMGTSPVILQAIAEVNSAQGAAIQAGLHPNPTIGYEGDTVGSGGTANYQGAYFNQLIKTAGKLDLARQTLLFDVRNAELALRKSRIGLISVIQNRYYAVLVAEEAVKSTHALAAFTDQAYRVQIEQLRGGEAAAYEPMQLRVQAIQARTALVQARNRYYSAWNQLAAAANVPNLPPTQLAGNLHVPVPTVRFDLIRDQMLRIHPDMMAAGNSEMQARTNLRLQQVTPFPDMQMYFTLQKDYTTPPFGATFNTQIGFPTALFDRNTGAILQAQADLAKASQQAARVRNELVASLADAFERYENNRAIVDYYRTLILPDQARVYRGVYERHQQQPDRVSFGDVVVAQQTLAASIGSYVQALGAQWTAVTDLQNLLQVEDVGELVAPPEPVPAPPPAEAPKAE